MDICSRCERVRPNSHHSGLCRPCYVRQHARTAVCSACKETRQIQGHGLCRRCYLAQPHVREKKNKARQEKYANDPARRRDHRAAQLISGKGPEQQRARNRRHFYKLEPDAFKAMWDKQGGQCPVCAVALVEGRGQVGCHVDHCHTTGRVRGLLCGRCNSGLGMLRDDPTLLERGAAYLRGATIPG
jgi:hypothetical protein